LILSYHHTLKQQKMKITAFTLLSALAAVESFAPAASRFGGRRTTLRWAVSKDSLHGAQEMIDSIINEKNCNPFFVRLAWHDSGTYDASIKEWPACGGADGSIRFAPEINHGANNGLKGAVDLLNPVKEKFPDISYADIYQMASARSVELAGGPKIDMK
jgi:L-ascorbate peroxidase